MNEHEPVRKRGEQSSLGRYSHSKQDLSPWGRAARKERRRSTFCPAWHPLYVRRLSKEDAHGRSLSPSRSTEQSAFNALASILVRDRQRALTADTSASPVPTVPRSTRRLCGRWLIVQSLRLGHTIDDCAAQAGIGAESITELTLGIADDFDPLDDRWSALATQLADTYYHADLVRAIIRLAGGDSSVPEQVVCQIAHDLNSPS